MAPSPSWCRKIPRLQGFRPIIDTGQTILAGMGELHLEIIVDRMQPRVRRGSANVGKPQVAYRETHPRQFSRSLTTRHKKQSGGKRSIRSRASCAYRTARTRETEYEFVNDVRLAVTIPKEFIPGHRKGIVVRVSRSTACFGRLPALEHQNSRCSTVTLTMSTRRKWRSRFAASIWRSRKLLAEGEAGSAGAGDEGGSCGARRIHGTRSTAI